MGEPTFSMTVSVSKFHLVSVGTKYSTKSKIKRATALRSSRYAPYDTKNLKSRTEHIARRKTKAKRTEFYPDRTYSNFLFLDDMFTMSTKEVRYIARSGHGYKLILSQSADSLKSDEAIAEQSRLTVSNAPGTCWIKYS